MEDDFHLYFAASSSAVFLVNEWDKQGTVKVNITGEWPLRPAVRARAWVDGWVQENNERATICISSILP